MFRQGFIAAALVCALAAHADAQTAWTFSWARGQVLTTRVEHTTAVTETISGAPNEITSKLVITKNWRVLDVDADGNATIEQSLSSLKNEQNRPGSALVFDSNDLAKSTPELKGMIKFINVPVAVIRVDRLGRVLEVKSGPKGKYDAEPPFVLVLPGQAVREGQAWLRPYTLTLDPPLGLGEKFQAEQLAKLIKIDGEKATIELSTTIKNPPTAAADKVPLLQKRLSGQLVFDIAKGRVESVRLGTDETVANHQGAGSSYRFMCNYTEQIIVPTSPIIPTSGAR
jgi:hypothetical protein